MQPYCTLNAITLNDAHSTCVAMYVSSVSISTLNCVAFSISQPNLTLRGASLILSVLKGISVNEYVQHFVCRGSHTSALRIIHGRCTVRW